MRYPRFSPDGSTIYFFGLDNAPGGFNFGVWSMPASGGEPQPVVYFDDASLAVFSPPNNGIGFGMLAVGRDEIYLSVGDSESDIWVMDLDW